MFPDIVYVMLRVIHIIFVIIVMKLAYTSHVLAAGMSECGRWQSNYRTLHQDIINDKVEGGKYLISIAPPQGLADRLGGYITHFLFALLTDRAYLQITLPSDAPMSAAYDCKFINSNLLHHLESKSDPFSYSFGDFQEELLALPVVGYDAINKYVAEHPKTTARPVNLKKNHGEYLNAGPGMSSKQRIAIRKKNKVLFTQSDFNALPYSDIKRVFFLGNRGFSYAMFDNPHHNHTLSAMGLTRENAFRCVFDYLFGFNVQHNCAGGCRDMRSAVLAQQAAGGAVIGVHVRVGDHVFSDADADVETEIGISEEQAAKLLAIAEPFLHCALSLRKELSLLRGGRPTAPILFMSDSVLLRKLVVGQLGTGVVIVSPFRYL